jgi:hypothetical protein
MRGPSVCLPAQTRESVGASLAQGDTGGSLSLAQGDTGGSLSLAQGDTGGSLSLAQRDTGGSLPLSGRHRRLSLPLSGRHRRLSLPLSGRHRRLSLPRPERHRRLSPSPRETQEALSPSLRETPTVQPPSGEGSRSSEGDGEGPPSLGLHLSCAQNTDCLSVCPPVPPPAYMSQAVCARARKGRRLSLPLLSSALPWREGGSEGGRERGG